MNNRVINPGDFFQALIFATAIGCLSIAVATFLFGEKTLLQNNPIPVLLIAISTMIGLSFLPKKEK